jgi:hypothetical protein
LLAKKRGGPRCPEGMHSEYTMQRQVIAAIRRTAS